MGLPKSLVVCLLLLVIRTLGGCADVADGLVGEQPEQGWCAQIPRPANEAFRQVSESGDWFTVYALAPDTFALVEARQFQEVISYLILGQDGALLFDTGLGLLPIRPVVESLTRLPVTVLNSHTHFDHVGGNAEFDLILAVDTPYTRRNQQGFGHTLLAGEVAAEAFCGEPAAAADLQHYRTRPWAAAARVADGDLIDLGGRVLEVLQVPGHTPDSVALLDADAGMLWTGDTYYDAGVWLFVPETDLDAYERSIARLAALAPQLKYLLPAHNTVAADPLRLAEMGQAIRAVREGRVAGKNFSAQRVEFDFPPHFSIVTAQPLLDQGQSTPPTDGSGLTGRL